MAERRIINGFVVERQPDGSLRTIGSASEGARPPVDPTFQYKGEGAALENASKRAGITNDAERLNINRQQLTLQQQQAAIQAAAAKQAQEAAALKQRQAEAEAAAKDQYNPAQLDSAASDAMSKLQTIDSIRDAQTNSWLPTTGFGAETLAGFGGTGAADVAASAETLKSGSALSEILKMTQATGKNPFTPMSNSDVDLIARNTGNLNQRQTPQNFNRNLNNYKDAYVRAYAGARGAQVLNSEIDRQTQLWRQQHPQATPQQLAVFRSVMQIEARKNYERAMSAKRTPAPRTQARVIDFNDLP